MAITALDIKDKQFTTKFRGDNEQEVYYEDEDNEEKDDKEQGLFSKLSKMYNSFFE